MISVLFTRVDSIYKTLGCDCWDIERDARNYNGDGPVICHPPCRSWSNMSHLSKPLAGENDLAIWSINLIRKNGGVLEHPKNSRLWKVMFLPKPGTTDCYGGFSLCVNQSWFGHLAEKKSLLYVCGINKNEVPPIPIRFDAIEYTVSSRIKKKSGRRTKRELSKKQREQTPIDFAKWLIELAEKCEK